jgi:hypothetical protein
LIVGASKRIHSDYAIIPAISVSIRKIADIIRSAYNARPKYRASRAGDGTLDFPPIRRKQLTARARSNSRRKATLGLGEA